MMLSAEELAAIDDFRFKYCERLARAKNTEKIAARRGLCTFTCGVRHLQGNAQGQSGFVLVLACHALHEFLAPRCGTGPPWGYFRERRCQRVLPPRSADRCGCSDVEALSKTALTMMALSYRRRTA
jgi:hypothetical protein